MKGGFRSVSGPPHVRDAATGLPLKMFTRFGIVEVAATLMYLAATIGLAGWYP